jgi:hypothetical protein
MLRSALMSMLVKTILEKAQVKIGEM